MDAEVELNRNWVRRTGVMTAVASFALVVLTACGGGGEEAHEDVTRVPVASDAAAQATRDAANAPAATPDAEDGILAAEATPGAAGDETAAAAMAVAVVSQDIFFEPSEVTIPANTDVTVNLPNEGAAPHNFSIDELGIDVDIAPGATEQVVINAPAGEYEFYCNVPGHKEAGMVGTLIVTEDAAAAAPAENETESAATPAEDSPVEASPAAATSAADAEEQATAGQGAGVAVEVVSLDVFFEPAELSIPADTDVTVSLPNEGVTPHNFSIDELGINVDIAPGATEETVINAPAGEYEYYCNIPGHKQAGMVGTLIVTDDAAATGDTTASAAAQQDAAPPAHATATGATTEATPDAGEEESAAGAGAGAPVTVESYDIYFEPDELSMPADTEVTVSLPNEGMAPHNFSIDELGIDVDIAPGATEETVINAPAGTYEYYCNVPGHKEAGMVGTLTVG